MMAMIETFLVKLYPRHVVASLNNTIYDSYLTCSMESNKQQIHQVRIQCNRLDYRKL